MHVPTIHLYRDYISWIKDQALQFEKYEHTCWSHGIVFVSNAVLDNLVYSIQPAAQPFLSLEKGGTHQKGSHKVFTKRLALWL